MVKMVIELNDRGILVEGPLENRPLCYALLRGAEEVVREYPKNKVVGITGGPSISGPVRSN